MTDAAAPAVIAEAARALAAGEVLAFPTETVYGLGADAANPVAVERVFALKQRPSTHPLIVHLASLDHARRWAESVPEVGLALARRFWPGPLTLIVRKAAHVDAIVTGGQHTIGLRVPSHPIAQQLLRAFGAIGSGAIAAPSANRFGRLSATCAAHVRDEFGDGVRLVVDGGASDVGIESTIVDVSSGRAVLLRPGAIDVPQLAAVLGELPSAPDAHSPRASGTLASHYAPTARVMLVEPDLVAEVARFLVDDGKSVAVLARTAGEPLLPSVRWQRAPRDPVPYAHELYATLRALDRSGTEVIVVERLPAEGAWSAIVDRLARAAAERTGSADDLAEDPQPGAPEQ
ncbi:MAG: threonylcarbamoyl-AMP synthase [Proteobacteria bacterium]|nr:threonylcarbamoyl-AMP synthase [Burkholderiales bacterium]